MSDKPKLLFFMPSLAAGGAEFHTLKLIERLRPAGFHADILVFGAAASASLLADPTLKGAHRLGLRGMSDLAGWFKVWAALRARAPDVIVCVNQTPFLVAEIARMTLATRAKLVCIFHTTVLQPFESHLERPFFWLAPFLDLLVFVGEAQQRHWGERGLRARRETLIRNGVDLNRYDLPPNARAVARAQLGLAADGFVLGMVAAFRTEKRHIDVIRALSLARERGSRAQLIAVGDGPTDAAARHLARSLNVEDAVRFVGEQSDVRPYLAAADVGVLASSVETFPLTVLEFLAAGRPILTSAVAGALEIAPESNRLVHPVGDVEQLAENILAAERPAVYASLRHGARQAAERFPELAMISAYAQEFQRLFDDL